MTTTLAEPLAGLRELLERFAAERDGVLGVLPGLIADSDAGWLPATGLAGDSSTPLIDLIARTALVRDAPTHVAAALMWKTYGYWHTVPMALGWALNRRVPIMDFADTVYRPSDAGVTVAATSVRTAVLPDDPLAGAPGTTVVSDLGAVIREALLAGQRPVIQAIGRLTRLGERNLWGSTAESLAHPLAMFAGALPAQSRPADLIAAVGGPVEGLLDFTGDTYMRRTCCLWITLPDITEPCATCCVLTRGGKGI